MRNRLAGWLRQEHTVQQPLAQLRSAFVELCAQTLFLLAQHRTAVTEMATHGFQRLARQAEGHAALQAEERRAHAGQVLARIVVQQPVAGQLDRREVQCSGIA